jgi:hypothetical protein
VVGIAGWKIAIRRRIVSCCARAASGHVAAAPPSSVMNSRRRMSSIGRLPPAGAARQLVDRQLLTDRYDDITAA